MAESKTVYLKLNENIEINFQMSIDYESPESASDEVKSNIVNAINSLDQEIVQKLYQVNQITKNMICFGFKLEKNIYIADEYMNGVLVAVLPKGNSTETGFIKYNTDVEAPVFFSLTNDPVVNKEEKLFTAIHKFINRIIKEDEFKEHDGFKNVVAIIEKINLVSKFNIFNQNKSLLLYYYLLSLMPNTYKVSKYQNQVNIMKKVADPAMLENVSDPDTFQLVKSQILNEPLKLLWIFIENKFDPTIKLEDAKEIMQFFDEIFRVIQGNTTLANNIRKALAAESDSGDLYKSMKEFVNHIKSYEYFCEVISNQNVAFSSINVGVMDNETLEVVVGRISSDLSSKHKILVQEINELANVLKLPKKTIPKDFLDKTDLSDAKASNRCLDNQGKELLHVAIKRLHGELEEIKKYQKLVNAIEKENQAVADIKVNTIITENESITAAIKRLSAELGKLEKYNDLLAGIKNLSNNELRNELIRSSIESQNAECLEARIAHIESQLKYQRETFYDKLVNQLLGEIPHFISLLVSKVFPETELAKPSLQLDKETVIEALERLSSGTEYYAIHDSLFAIMSEYKGEILGVPVATMLSSDFSESKVVGTKLFRKINFLAEGILKREYYKKFLKDLTNFPERKLEYLAEYSFKNKIKELCKYLRAYWDMLPSVVCKAINQTLRSARLYDEDGQISEEGFKILLGILDYYKDDISSKCAALSNKFEQSIVKMKPYYLELNPLLLLKATISKMKDGDKTIVEALEILKAYCKTIDLDVATQLIHMELQQLATNQKYKLMLNSLVLPKERNLKDRILKSHKDSVAYAYNALCYYMYKNRDKWKHATNQFEIFKFLKGELILNTEKGDPANRITMFIKVLNNPALTSERDIESAIYKAVDFLGITELVNQQRHPKDISFSSK